MPEITPAFTEIFEIRKVNKHPLRANTSFKDASLPGLISCTMPFLAIGCSEGIWVVDSSNPDLLHHVLDIKGTTEFAVIEEYRILLVLANKALHCLSLDALDPSSPLKRVPQKLSIPTNIDLFRSLYQFMTNGQIEGVFTMLEPICEEPPPESVDPIVVNLGDGRVLHFKERKSFFLPEASDGITFLKGKLAISHTRGFEILDLDNAKSLTVPDKDSFQMNALYKRCRASRALHLSYSADPGFLLCYDTFGVLVDRFGQPVAGEDSIIEWHGTVSAVVPIAPYIVLFKARSIEIRDGSTGRLEQVIFGNGMYCSWQGPGAVRGGLNEDHLVPELEHERSRIQVVMNAPHGMGSKEVAQHVYDLVLKKSDEQ
ncbi:CNH domain-containing protein [Hysterangium stoloniferum]|nr:CNH domain-containing protein [Hysterangium stoloniferum]